MATHSLEYFQMKNRIRERIIENCGELIYEDHSQIRAIFSEDKIETAIKTFFEITEKLNQKAVLSGGNEITVFF
jgi:hypothetical protein